MIGGRQSHGIQAYYILKEFYQFLDFQFLTHSLVVILNQLKCLKNFIKRISSCRFLISDSGGVQEEASFLKKRVIICRQVTERPEALKSFNYLCKKVGDLPKIFNRVKDNYIPSSICPFGDGKAAEKILQIL